MYMNEEEEEGERGEERCRRDKECSAAVVWQGRRSVRFAGAGSRELLLQLSCLGLLSGGEPP